MHRIKLDFLKRYPNAKDHLSAVALYVQKEKGEAINPNKGRHCDFQKIHPGRRLALQMRDNSTAATRIPKLQSIALSIGKEISRQLRLHGLLKL